MAIVTDRLLRDAFGAQVSCEGPLASSGAGLRISGIDLNGQLTPGQVAVLLDVLGQCRILILSGQDLDTFTVANFERFANHWGAPLPHPSNFNQQDLESFMKMPELLPLEDRLWSKVNAAFPEQLRCLPGADSPAVLVVANMRGLSDEEREEGPTLTRGSTWHTDIEHHTIPLNVSLFYVHKVPVARDAPGGTWVPDPCHGHPPNEPNSEDADAELMRLRRSLPLNGETAFADTAAALAALPIAEQSRLSSVRVRRHWRSRNNGDWVPLVNTNPRSGIRSLHSPLWRPRALQVPVEVHGMSPEASRDFLEGIEAHVLQREFRYDHAHAPGDVTLWDLYMTIHIGPPMKENIQSIDDARLLYRISCKGEPALTLPRRDSPDWIDEHVFQDYTTPADVIGVN